MNDTPVRPIEPPLQIIERIVVAAFGLLDLLHEAAKEPFDRLLLREILAPARAAMTRGAGLPTFLRRHDVRSPWARGARMRVGGSCDQSGHAKKRSEHGDKLK